MVQVTKAGFPFQETASLLVLCSQVIAILVHKIWFLSEQWQIFWNLWCKAYIKCLGMKTREQDRKCNLLKTLSNKIYNGIITIKNISTINIQNERLLTALASENCVYLSKPNSLWRPDYPLASIIFLSINTLHSHAIAAWPEFSRYFITNSFQLCQCHSVFFKTMHSGN